MSSGTAREHVRVARAHRKCSAADDAAARVRRRVRWRFEEDGLLSGSFRLPPLDGAVLLKALRAAAAGLEPPGGAEPPGVSAETPPPSPPPADPADPAGPADPGRCHVEDGPAVSVTTAQMLSCTAALSWMRHGDGGKILDLGRRRRPSAALRKAARERDHGRCRYPGCESRRVGLHHIRHWASGGRTGLDNLISLSKKHHTAVHDRGYLIAARPDGTFAFYDPGGAAIPPSPALPAPDGPIAGVHDAEVTPDTIIPPWSGERLDLDYAICTGLANEKILTDRAAGRPVDALATSGFQPKRCGDPYCGFCFSLPLPATGAQIPVPV
jgi:HNH endonuclease